MVYTCYGYIYSGYSYYAIRVLNKVRAEFARLWGGGLGGKAAGELSEQGY